MKIKSVKELKALRDKLDREINVRSNGKWQSDIRVIVGMATCGIAAGAGTVYEEMLDEVKKLKLKNVSVIKAGCMGSCYAEPTVEVRVPGQEPILYGNVSPEVGREIIKQHVGKGTMVEGRIIGRPFETI